MRVGTIALVTDAANAHLVCCSPPPPSIRPHVLVAVKLVAFACLLVAFAYVLELLPRAHAGDLVSNAKNIATTDALREEPKLNLPMATKRNLPDLVRRPLKLQLKDLLRLRRARRQKLRRRFRQLLRQMLNMLASIGSVPSGLRAKLGLRSRIAKLR